MRRLRAEDLHPGQECGGISILTMFFLRKRAVYQRQFCAFACAGLISCLPLAQATDPAPTLPTVLGEGLNAAITTPFHFGITTSSTLLPVQVTAWGAVDPTHRESIATAQTQLLTGISVTASSISIGDTVWYRTSPPGGPYQKGTVPVQIPTSIPWKSIRPFLENVRAVPGKMVRGKPTLGFYFTVNKRGIALLEQAGASLPVGSIRAASGTIYLDANGPHYPLLAELTETFVQLGYQSTLRETVSYQQWGVGLHLVPPQASSEP